MVSLFSFLCLGFPIPLCLLLWGSEFHKHLLLAG